MERHGIGIRDEKYGTDETRRETRDEERHDRQDEAEGDGDEANRI